MTSEPFMRARIRHRAPKAASCRRTPKVHVLDTLSRIGTAPAEKLGIRQLELHDKATIESGLRSLALLLPIASSFGIENDGRCAGVAPKPSLGKERVRVMSRLNFETAFVTGQPLHVLMVEDSPIDAELSLQTLRSHGYNV